MSLAMEDFSEVSEGSHQIVSNLEYQTTVCPFCKSPDSAVSYSGRDHLYGIPGIFYASTCLNCGLLYQNPRPRDGQVVELYPSHYLPHRSFDRRMAIVTSLSALLRRTMVCYSGPHPTAKSCARRRSTGVCAWVKGVLLIPEYVEGGSLLEIGCATGMRLQLYRALGWTNLFGVELAEDAARESAKKGFDVKCGDADKMLLAFPGSHFDVIVLSMVLEHLTNPCRTIELLTAKLKPSGQLLLSTISRDCWDFRHYREYWAGFDFPRHMVFLRKSDILHLLAGRFESIAFFQHFSPRDYSRSSRWRCSQERGRLLDMAVMSVPFFKEALGLCALITQRSCRISIAARKAAR